MSNYHAYLIRLWRENEHLPWRAELEASDTGEKRRFAAPEQAYAYLQQKLEREVSEGIYYKETKEQRNKEGHG